jgi:hypothetical protein
VGADSEEGKGWQANSPLRAGSIDGPPGAPAPHKRRWQTPISRAVISVTRQDGLPMPSKLAGVAITLGWMLDEARSPDSIAQS